MTEEELLEFEGMWRYWSTPLPVRTAIHALCEEIRRLKEREEYLEGAVETARQALYVMKEESRRMQQELDERL